VRWRIGSSSELLGAHYALPLAAEGDREG
jgi:hypothetical protein